MTYILASDARQFIINGGAVRAANQMHPSMGGVDMVLRGPRDLPYLEFFVEGNLRKHGPEIVEFYREDDKFVLAALRSSKFPYLAEKKILYVEDVGNRTRRVVLAGGTHVLVCTARSGKTFVQYC